MDKLESFFLNNEEWTIVWPFGIYKNYDESILYLEMLIGRRMPGTDFGLQFKALILQQTPNRPLLMSCAA